VDIDYLWHLASIARADLALARAHAAGTAAEQEIWRAAENVEAIFQALTTLRDSRSDIKIDRASDVDPESGGINREY
jgi:hypothetical protein